jgi:flagellar assembly protein FliH
MKTIIYSPDISKSTDISMLDRDNAVGLDVPADATRNADASHYDAPVVSNEHTDRIHSLEQELTELKQENNNLQSMLEKTNGQYDSVLENVESLKNEAIEKGSKAAIDMANQDVSELKEKWLRALDDLIKKSVETLVAKEDECVEVVYAAVCRIIGVTATDKHQVLSIVKEVLGHITNPVNQTVYVSAYDYDLLSTSDEIVNANIIQSDDVKHGGCIVKFGSGRLDARLELQLDKLKDVLLKVHSDNVQGH